MKNFAKKWLIVLLTVAMVFSVFAFVACGEDEEKKAGYTVTVIGPDGSPYTTALVQPCEVGDDGILSTCYSPVPTDSNGTVFLQIGKHVENKNANLIEIHLQNLPVYLTYPETRMKKNESVTIKLSEKSTVPTTGTGTGGYSESLGDTIFDLSIFDPYQVGEGAYKVKFTSTDNIYFAFEAEEAGKYKVYSVGSVDASVTQLLGSVETTIYNPGEADYKNDNVSATDKNFLYEFKVSKELVRNEGGMCYFEVALENAADVDKDFLVCFEYVGKLEEQQGPETVDKEPAHALDAYANQEGKFINIDIYDGPFDFVKDANGYYHVGDENGYTLVATLGNDEQPPRFLDAGFMQIYEQGQSFTFGDGKTYSYNYYPLVSAYANAANDDGCYPITDELIEFFNVFMQNAGFLNQMEMYGIQLPKGKEWIVWCGYYAPSGVIENPIELAEGESSFDVKVPAGGKVYYLFERNIHVTVTIKSASTNVAFKWYVSYDPTDGDTAESTDTDFECTIVADWYTQYYFVFSTKNGAAETYTITVEEESNEPDGSIEKPFIAEAGWNSGETTEESGSVKPLYYRYTVSEIDETLYFYVGENTVIVSVQYTDSSEQSHELTFAQLEGGLSVPTDTELLIKITTESGAGEYKFGIYNAPLGTADNPYLIEEVGEFDVTVAASKTVYYNFMAEDDAEYTFTSTSNDVKLVWYAYGEEQENNKTTVTSDETGFTCTIAASGSIILEFSSKSGEAAEYTVNMAMAYALGSEQNPKTITQLGTINDTTQSGRFGVKSIYYTFEVTEDMTLYFARSTTTTLVVTYTDESGEQMKWLNDYEDDLTGGIALKAGTVITIEVGSTNWTAGPVEFTISATPI
ncbi:MAG: hypothetical protein J1G01_02730 [Clostridiales bacterium]|nr:hypothetical protein [Clostridiales bacterium]